MRPSLRERLEAAKDALDRVNAALDRYPGVLLQETEESFRAVVAQQPQIDYCLEILDARGVAWQFIDGLESRADSNDCVSTGAGNVRYMHARLLGVQAYVTITWALADKITGMVGQVLCVPKIGLNPASPAQLVQNIIKRDNAEKQTAAPLFDSIREPFGWPIALSYAIRNHFAHDGGQCDGSEFFEGSSALSGFRIADDAWKSMVGIAEKSCGRVDQSWHRVGAGWPSSPENNFRVIMNVCEREMDDALGVLIGTACRSLLAHVGFMLGED